MAEHLNRIEPYIVETAFVRFVHREFPVLIARVKQIKNRDAGEIVRVTRKAA